MSALGTLLLHCQADTKAGERVRVFYCNNVFDHPQTGGELFYNKTLGSLTTHSDVELILPTEVDLQILNRPHGCLGINRYFFERFRHLPEGTIVLESEHFLYSFFLANWMTKLCRGDIRFVVQVCQLPAPLETSWASRLIRRILLFIFLRSADRVTVLSKFLGRQMINLGALEEKVRVVGIAGQPLRLPAVKRSSSSDGRIQLLCVAHIRPLKGQQTLVEALDRLHNQSVELALVGGTKDEHYELELRNLIGELGLGKQIRLVGRLEGDDLAHAYAEADIFVLPSLYEAYGIVIQEAMSFGLPVVASDVGGIPEQVRDGVEGFLVPPGDPSALTEALHRLIEDPELRARMGKQGHQRAAELLTWDHVYERYYQALATVGE